MDLKELLGKSIQELRLRLGLTQEKLSEALGISINQIQNIEQRRSLPSLRVLLKLHQKYVHHYLVTSLKYAIHRKWYKGHYSDNQNKP